MALLLYQAHSVLVVVVVVVVAVVVMVVVVSVVEWWSLQLEWRQEVAGT